MRASTRRGAGLLVLAMWSGCLARSPDPAFYTLIPLASEPAASVSANAPDGPGVGVGPVRLPRYLDRPEIATRGAGGRLEYQSGQRWAAGLEYELLRVLGANLANLLETDRVVVYPTEPAYPLAVRVRVDVERFEGTPGHAVLLEARWWVVPNDGRGEPRVGRSRIRQPVEAGGIDGFVTAHSQAVATLSREIAQAVRAMHR